MRDRLRGRTAIITGAGQGIGEAIARRFVQEGARVVIAELNPATGEAVAEDLRSRGAQAICVPTDVADDRAVREMVEVATRAFGPPDTLVNNAGINVFGDPVALSDAEWERCFAVDLKAVWQCCRAVLPHMLTLGKGSIVNIASVHSFQIIPGCFPYPVAKHGLIGLTRALAVEYGPRSIRVNAICPSYIDTPLNITRFNSYPDPAAARLRAEQYHPLKRIGTPDEVAWPAVFLASDEAGFVNGASLMVDGGRSVMYHE